MDAFVPVVTFSSKGDISSRHRRVNTISMYISAVCAQRGFKDYEELDNGKERKIWEKFLSSLQVGIHSFNKKRTGQPVAATHTPYHYGV